jgi:hypothetical protein
MINNLFDIQTLHTDQPYRYGMNIHHGCMLSILTGSHYESASLGTLEIALMKNNVFIFGSEDTDESIIHYISPDMANEMVRDLLQAKDETVIKTVFKTYQQAAKTALY